MKNKFNNKKNLVLIDTNAWIHHSYHGDMERIDKNGKDQRILHGVLNRIQNLTYILPKIDNLFLIFDSETSRNYRTNLFPDYKAHRPEEEIEFKRQKEDMLKVIKKYIGLPCIVYDNYEADDVIGTMAYTHKDEYQVIIVSPDKDLMQLVTDDILMLKKNKKNMSGYDLLNEADIIEKIGVSINQIPDFLALIGDTVDNLPGVDGVGEKTAVKILNKYKSIEHILSFVEEIDNPKLKQNILLQKDLILIKKIATIVTDLNLQDFIDQENQRVVETRNLQDYNLNLLRLEKYFNWKENFTFIYQN